MTQGALVQVRNPRSGEWVKVDTAKGLIVGHREKPWTGIPIARPGQVGRVRVA